MNQNILQIPPKQRTVAYKRHKIVVRYVPDTEEWEWSFDHVRTMSFDGRAKTFDKAIQLAKKRVDTLLGDV